MSDYSITASTEVDIQLQVQESAPYTVNLFQGPQGPAGSQILTGAGVPSSGLGAVGDLYINTTNDDYYKKTGPTTWVLQGNLEGATGPAGPQTYIGNIDGGNANSVYGGTFGIDGGNA